MSIPTRLRLAFGACVLLASLLPAAVQAEPSVHLFEVVPGSFHVTPSTTQAGAHENLVVAFDFAHEAGGETDNDVRTIVTNLPEGFDANDTAVPTCSDAQLTGGGEDLAACPVASQVGTISFEVANIHSGLAPAQFTVPLYNMEVTSFGVTAELGFKSFIFTQILQVAVRPGDYGLTSTTPNIDKAEPRNVSVTLWGLPAAHEHDAQRGETCGEGFEVPAVCEHLSGPGGPQEAGIPVKPFLSNPTSCGSFEASMEADSWEEPLTWSKATGQVGPIVECERVPFEPEIEVQPTTNRAESPSGLNVSLIVPQTWENPYSISTSDLKDTTLTLPEGMTVNPSAGSGLGACTPAQYASETSSSLPGEGCPPESKIGSIVIETPLLDEKIEGAVYVATPYDNPFPEPGHPNGSLLGLYIVAKDPVRGILIKLAGRIEPNRQTTTFGQPAFDGLSANRDCRSSRSRGSR